MLDTNEKFTFDFVAAESVSQEQMFQRLGRPIVDFCLQGYNSTIFAYGQTGSGKTHSIQGRARGDGEDQRGLLPRQFEYLFSEIGKILAKHRLKKER